MQCVSSDKFVRFSVAALIFGMAIGVSACNKSPSPSDPGDPGLTLSGTFAGTAADPSGPGRLTWQLTQSGQQVSGTLSFQDDRTAATGNGSVSGSLSGPTLTFSMEIRSGGVSAPFGGCTIAATGTAQATTTTINGTFTGRNSCTSTFTNGTIALTKS